MSFLRVFCVVLCVRSGAFLQIQNNVPDISYQNQEAIQVSAHRNNDIPLNNPYDNEFRNQPIRRFGEQLTPQKNVQFEPQSKFPEYANSQQIKNTNEKLTGDQAHYFQDQAHPKYLNLPARRFNDAQPKFNNPREDNSKPMLQENTRLDSSRISPKYLQQIKNTNEQLIDQEKSNNQGVQHFQTHPEYILPEAKRFNEVARIPEENISGSKFHFSISNPARHDELPRKPVNEGSAFTDSKNIISHPIKQLLEPRHTPVEDVKLELQAYPEYIKSLINTKKINSDDIVKYSDNKHFNSKNYFERNEATYENPSAEVLYSTKRAIPYEIEEQQIPKLSQGSMNFNNNADSRRIQNIQKLMQPSMRYMIIHPDGRVEHVDEIEKITKIHPNYVMIKSQDFLKHIEGKSGVSRLQIPQLYAQNLYDSIVNQKRSEVYHHPTGITSGQKSSPQFVNNPLYTTVTDSVQKLLVSNEPKLYPTHVKTVQVNSHTLPENNNDENQLLNKEHMAAHLLPDIKNHQENNNIKKEQTMRQLTPYAKENEFKNIESTSVSSSDIKQIQSKNKPQITAYDSAFLSSTIATITEKNNDNFDKTVIATVNKTEMASSPFVNLTLKDSLPKPPHNRQIILNNASEQHNLNTLLLPKISTKTATVITDNNIKNISQTAALPTLNTNKTGIEAIKFQNSNGTVSNGTVSNNTQVFYKTPETLPDINHEISDTLYTTRVPENGVISINTNTTSAPIPNETSPSKNNQRENTNKNATNMPALNVTSPSTTPLSNTENSTNNTGFWFQADEQFWHNIMSKNDTQNLFYFFFVPPKTNIMQRETKTTLYPNGTTIEEVSETIDEDGVPRVIKTTKVFVNSTSTDT